MKRENTEGLYGPDLYTDFLIQFMAENKANPFLAYYPMALAHDVSNDFTPPPPPGPDGLYQSYEELIARLDKNIGKLVAALDSLGLRKNTLILFTADNGTPQRVITDIRGSEYIRIPVVSRWGNAKIPGGKGTLKDPGTHVPMFANRPGHVPAGKICQDLIDFTDFLPTLAEIAGAAIPADRIIDGHSFANQLHGIETKRRNWVYNQFEGEFWMRNHRWKLYGDGRMFDMTSDPFELNPVLKSMDNIESADARNYLEEALQSLRDNS
jgi:arylsulfatase A